MVICLIRSLRKSCALLNSKDESRGGDLLLISKGAINDVNDFAELKRVYMIKCICG